jgi:flavorubredoxin
VVSLCKKFISLVHPFSAIERGFLLPRILILYYSQTGNTEKMANAIADGAKSAGKVDVELEYHVDSDDLNRFDAIVVGAPTYHHEIPMDIKRLFEEAAVKGVALEGKTGAAFGSYGWSGEAPKLVLEIMKNRFEMRVVEPPLLVRYVPDQDSLSACRDLGKRVSESLIHEA